MQSVFTVAEAIDIPKIQKLSCKVNARPKRTMNYEVQKKMTKLEVHYQENQEEEEEADTKKKENK